MKIATVTITGITPYSQGKYHQTPKLEKELNDAYELRTWRERLHYTDDGFIFIPPMAFKNALTSAAKYLGEQIPGKGKRTWTKVFTSGIMIADIIKLPIKKDDVQYQDLFLPADGVRGSGKRVMKRFSVIHKWGATFDIHILDDTITENVFKRHMEEAGKFIGIGVFRPENNGFFGRFRLDSITWSH